MKANLIKILLLIAMVFLLTNIFSLLRSKEFDEAVMKQIVWDFLNEEDKHSILPDGNDNLVIVNVKTGEKNTVNPAFRKAEIEIARRNDIQIRVNDSGSNFEWILFGFESVARVSYSNDREMILGPITYYVDIDDMKVIGYDPRF